MSKLIYLCEQQHRQILNLCRQVIEAYRGSLSHTEKQQVVKHLRQRLSRHIQLERHVLFPLLHRHTAGDEWINRRVQQLEQSIKQMVAPATLFLHEAEQHPERDLLRGAESFSQDMRHQFIQEEKNLHMLYLRMVPPQDERVQLDHFKQRLMATVVANTGSHKIVGETGNYPIVNQHTGSYKILYGDTGSHAILPELPPVLELDRHAETHPLGRTSHRLPLAPAQ